MAYWMQGYTVERASSQALHLGNADSSQQASYEDLNSPITMYRNGNGNWHFGSWVLEKVNTNPTRLKPLSN